jgi:hypothetical protein
MASRKQKRETVGTAKQKAETRKQKVGAGVRLSREKIVRLSHQITEVLVASDDVEFVDDRDTIRQQVVLILTATLKEEEKVELEVRKKITSQKKEILEGSEEWDVLFKKYYGDELRRMGIASAPDDREHRRS